MFRYYYLYNFFSFELYFIYKKYREVLTNMSEQNNELPDKFNTTVSLLNVYLSELIHRDQIFKDQVFKFFYTILIIMLLPNLALHFQLELPDLPVFIYRLLGLFGAFIFLYISLGYAMRLQAASETYQNVINQLPINYRRKYIYTFKLKGISIGKIFMPKLSYIVCFSLFFILLFLSIFLIII